MSAKSSAKSSLEAKSSAMTPVNPVTTRSMDSTALLKETPPGPGGYVITLEDGTCDVIDREPQPGDSAVHAAVAVLNTPRAVEKARKSEIAKQLIQSGEILLAPPNNIKHVQCPDRPARADDDVQVTDPRQVPRRKKASLRGKEARLQMLHSICHIESWAIDLSWDMVARFGPSRGMPEDFYHDWCRVAVEEADHFTRLRSRLVEQEKDYGAYAVHDGLWESAYRTKDSVLSRLAVEHCVHEARGLDVMPKTIAKFQDAGDKETVELLESIIYPEEITHCGAGVKWFRSVHGRLTAREADDVSAPWFDDEVKATRRDNPASDDDDDDDDDEGVVRRAFRHCVATYFHGQIKPPFNEEARAKANLPKAWYDPPPV
ncbi:DUF455 domain-containing protein [Pycnococcus provasolii]